MSAFTSREVAFHALIRDLRHMTARAASDLADWLVYLDLEGKADRSLYSYHRELARLLRAHPQLELGDFTHSDINLVLQSVPVRSRHITRSIYNRFFEWALMDDRIDRSPMAKVPRVKHPSRPITEVFQPSDIALLEALPSPHGNLFAILFGTGIRRAEARNLRRQDVDLDRRRIIVRHGKGGKGRIIAPLPSALSSVADLDLTERIAPADYLWHSRPGGGDVTRRNHPIGDTTFERWYREGIEAAGVTYRRPHTTRHTYQELCRKAGLTLEERQVLMGHASIRTTADIYGHLDFDEVADKLAGFKLENV
jgi:integrase